MKCPFCKAMIDDDSRYCDQCGKELHFAPNAVSRKGERNARLAVPI